MHEIHIYSAHCSFCEAEKTFFNFEEAAVWKASHVEKNHFGNEMVCNHAETDRVVLKSPKTDNEYCICEGCGQALPFFFGAAEMIDYLRGNKPPPPTVS